MIHMFQLEDLTGYHLQATDGEIGKLMQIYFDDQGWIVRYFVVRTGWLLGQDVLIVPSAVTVIDKKSKRLNVNLTCEQVKNSPPVNTQLPVSRHYEQKYFAYYGWEPYWNGNPMLGPVPTMPPVVEETPKKPEHPHLRSSDEVSGYHIQALNSKVGHIKDFILTEPTWAIAYLEIDTSKWFPGKKVLIAPSWIDQVDWAKKEVNVHISSELIASAPEYDAANGISSDYEIALLKHYGKFFE